VITRIDLRHFKCFDILKLPLSPLTLLSGTNASGKSSVMQALVLLHQTMREHEWSPRLMLNGSAIRLGTAAEVIDQVYGRRSCNISLFDQDGAQYSWEFEGERDEMSMAVRSFKGETSKGVDWESDNTQLYHWLLPAEWNERSLIERLRKLTYLTAERLGPREYYIYDDPQLTPVVGSRGEFAVSVLYSGRDQNILPNLVEAGVPPTRFRQVEAHMARFFPGCVLEIEQVPRANAVTLGIRISNDTDYHRPVNTGFGVTQVLPVVVAALSAEKDDIILIENPEVHLHPGGQAAMGRFLANTAASGVQVIIETHSDHILNGIRRTVKDGILSSESVSLHFFQPRRTDGADDGLQVQSPLLDGNGNVDRWPDGFFDQFDRDMNYFAGWN